MKIAVWHNLPSGGGKRQLYNHVKGLVERGHHVESWCPDTADQTFLPLRSLIQETIVPLRAVRQSFFGIFRDYETNLALVDAIEDNCRRCSEQMRSKGFDVLFGNACMFLRTTPIARFAGLPSSLYLGEPYRWYYEAMPELPWLAPPGAPRAVPWPALFRRKGFPRSSQLDGARYQARKELEYAREFDQILVNSVFTRETVLRTYNLESRVCYLGVDTDCYKPTGEAKENLVVGLGTIYHAKGVDRAIKAIACVPPQKRPDLVWIGNAAWPDDLKKYTELAEALGVRFTAKVDIPDREAVSLLSRAVALIYTSRLEPFGLAPLEANACGTPVVAIAEGGVRETIRDGVNGFLVQDDDPEALGAALLRLIERPALAVEMGLKAREVAVSTWNLDGGTSRIERYLTMLLDQKAMGAPSSSGPSRAV